jgi:acyl carrier protein
LYIGGDGLGRNYFNRPGLTAATFIPHPFSSEPGARLYKSHDLARYRADGNIEYLGRIDNQVKIRGYRIEVEEVEAVISQHPKVRETVVVAREDGLNDRRLVAYIIARTEQAPTPSELRSFLREKLPDYMIPSTFMFLDTLPLTINGKADRRALPAPDTARPELGEGFVAPRTPVEEVLARIWSQVFNLEKVGVNDNFFQLGGHSLLATQVISRASDALRVKLPLRRLFEAPTIAELAAIILKDQQDRGRIEKTAQLLLHLSQLSDDEVDKMLDEKRSSSRVAQHE